MAEESLPSKPDTWRGQPVQLRKPKTKAMKHKRF